MWTCCEQAISVALHGIYGTCSRAENGLKALTHRHAPTSMKFKRAGKLPMTCRRSVQKASPCRAENEDSPSHELEEYLQHVELL